MSPEVQNMPYQEFVQKLVKPGHVMDQEITKKEEELLNLAMNICRMSEILEDEPFLYLTEKTTSRAKILEYKHMTVGLVGEAGELLDAVKKIVIYRKPPVTSYIVDKTAQNVCEEIGDLMFFHTGHNLVVEEIGWADPDTSVLGAIEAFLLLWNELYPASKITIEDAIQFNKEKLSRRYEGLAYTDKQAQDRKDKQEEFPKNAAKSEWIYKDKHEECDTKQYSSDKVSAMQLILDERKRQIEKLGYTLESDDRYVNRELMDAAVCYEHGNAAWWPWDISSFHPKTEARNLVKAGALYHAEKGRLERAQEFEGAARMQDNIMRIVSKLQNIKVETI